MTKSGRIRRCLRWLSGIRRCQLWQYEELTQSELDYPLPLLLARDLGHLAPDAHAHLAEDVGEVRRMLYRFIQTLNAESG